MQEEKAIHPPAIEIAGMQLEKSLTELSSIIDALELRLGPVMRSVPETKSTGELAVSAALEMRSPLGTLLYRHIEEAERLTDRISSLMHRLEI